MLKYIRYFLFLSALASFVLFAACSKSSTGSNGIHNEVGNKFNRFGENPFVEASSNNVSTFSLDASNASYSYMRASINRRHLPLRFSVRIEEYLNYFTFNYPEPEGNSVVSVSGEIGVCPWAPTHRLMKLGVKGRTLDPGKMLSSNYVFLVDVSGSMNSTGKLPLFKSALKALVDKLDIEDRVSIVTYSGNVRVHLPSTKVAEISKIKEAIADLRAEGLIAQGDAVRIAFEEALSNYIDGGNNRVVIATDGDFNFGLSEADNLMDLVDEYAQKGIYLSLCGLETGDKDASLMESVANRGNGSFIYLDSEAELVKVFAHEKSDFYKVATDSKTKVVFDSKYISSWRLIGYDNGALPEGEVLLEKKFPGQIGAGQTVTALYELVPTENYQTGVPVAAFEFSCRESGEFRSFRTSVMEPMSMGRMLPELDFAAGVAAFGMVLMKSQYKGSATLEMAEKLVASGLPFDEHGYRAELMELIAKARSFIR